MILRRVALDAITVTNTGAARCACLQEQGEDALASGRPATAEHAPRSPPQSSSLLLDRLYTPAHGRQVAQAAAAAAAAASLHVANASTSGHGSAGVGPPPGDGHASGARAARRGGHASAPAAQDTHMGSNPEGRGLPPPSGVASVRAVATVRQRVFPASAPAAHMAIQQHLWPEARYPGPIHVVHRGTASAASADCVTSGAPPRHAAHTAHTARRAHSQHHHGGNLAQQRSVGNVDRGGAELRCGPEEATGVGSAVVNGSDDGHSDRRRVNPCSDVHLRHGNSSRHGSMTITNDGRRLRAGISTDDEGGDLGGVWLGGGGCSDNVDTAADGVVPGDRCTRST